MQKDFTIEEMIGRDVRAKAFLAKKQQRVVWRIEATMTLLCAGVFFAMLSFSLVTLAAIWDFAGTREIMGWTLASCLSVIACGHYCNRFMEAINKLGNRW